MLDAAQRLRIRVVWVLSDGDAAARLAAARAELMTALNPQRLAELETEIAHFEGGGRWWELGGGAVIGDQHGAFESAWLAYHRPVGVQDTTIPWCGVKHSARRL